MERVETLGKKFLEQIKSGAPVDQLLITVRMLQSELLHLQKESGANLSNQSLASVHIPTNMGIGNTVSEPEPGADKEKSGFSETKEQEKTFMVLQVNEDEIEAELEEIKKSAEEKEQMRVHNRPPLLFDPLEDIPTLSHQTPKKTTKSSKEINDQIGTGGSSLNDRLKQSKIELSDTLQEIPVKDLKKAIGLNDRYLFIKELFRDDETRYERSIKTINGFSIYAEAEFWIKRELKLKLGWDEKSPIVKQFDQLVRRRFL